MRIIPAIDIIDGKCVQIMARRLRYKKNIQRKSVGSSKRIRGLRHRIFALGGIWTAQNQSKSSFIKP